ncbi:gamma-glutamylcyclotransferase [Candidatus Uhrbacteria bacterium]|nr:gamma-glutamylcyclotransferase [Candidatus Uhrbacteria bacterium]
MAHPTSEHQIFAYGSNMHLPDLRRWLEEHGENPDGILRSEPATLRGWRIAWNYFSRKRNGGAANIVRAIGHILPGVVVSVDRPTLEAIDYKEGHPQYYDRGKRRLRVRLASGTDILAWTYIARREHWQRELVQPRRAYLDLLIEAARSHKLDPDHIAALEATPTVD